MLAPAASATGSSTDLAFSCSGSNVNIQPPRVSTNNATPEGVELKDYEDLALELSSVKSGQIPAAINDIPVLLDYVKKNPELEVAAQFETGEQYGFGMKKGTSDELKKVVDDVLKKAKSDGTYNELYKKWFGAEPE